MAYKKVAAEPTRFYLRTAGRTHRRFLWFHNHRPDEMLMGVYGLAGGPPTLSVMFPELTLSTSELSRVEYSYIDAMTVGKPVDHITCHADGRFHIKTRDQELYIQRMQRVQALGPDTPIFLNFIVVSDVASKYAALSVSPESPYAWIQAGEDQCVSMRGAFSGANYPLEAEAAATIAEISGGEAVAKPGILLESGTLKGVLWGEATKLSPEALTSRPPGTIVSFKFPVAGGNWCIKTLVFG